MLAHRPGSGDDEQLLADLERARRGIEPIGERERSSGRRKSSATMTRLRISCISVQYPSHERRIAQANPSGVSVRRGEYVSHLPQPGQRQ